jgi:type II secretory pathway predicted ATPase ExeA
MMTHTFFGLTAAPFSAAPNPQTYFAAGSSEQARHALARCLLNAEGVAMLVGAPGLGKTTLLGVLAQQLIETCDLAVLSAGHLTTRRSLLQSILYELQMPCVERDEGDMRLALLDRLSLADAAPLVILCDEAHTLPQRLLEELRLLNNVVRDGVSKIRLLLVGNPSLDERLTHPKLETLQQRIATRCYLHAWNRGETREFVRSRIYHAGGIPEQIFTHDALDAIFRATDGIPRLVTQVASHALSLAAEQGRHTLDKSLLEAAWADLQQLPPPSKGESLQFGKPETSSSVIEFGILDDQESEPAIELNDELDAPAIARRGAKNKENTMKSAIDAEFDDLSGNPDDQVLAAPRLFAGTEVDLDSADGDSDHFDREESELGSEDLDELQFSFNDDAAPFRPRVAASLDEEISDEATEATQECELELLPPLTEQVMLRQIETVTRHLERLEQDFQGSNMEIELTWEGSNPFSEAFLEEEIVLDPFLEQSLDIFDNKPMVNAIAGKHVGRSEERLPQIHAFVPKAAPAAAPCELAASTKKTPVVPAKATTEQPKPASEGLESIELVFAAPGQAANVANVIEPPSADCRIGGACGSKCRTSQLVQLETNLPETRHIASPQPASKPTAATPQIKAAEMHEEIIIDDGSENGDHDSRPMVKRQEYRSLFSKLKRG